ncbi:hypothetical protein [Xanthomonas phage JGB6]|nr:hypothetical protein [Xanthomonas phage JGB6]
MFEIMLVNSRTVRLVGTWYLKGLRDENRPSVIKALGSWIDQYMNDPTNMGSGVILRRGGLPDMSLHCEYSEVAKDGPDQHLFYVCVQGQMLRWFAWLMRIEALGTGWYSDGSN